MCYIVFDEIVLSKQTGMMVHPASGGTMTSISLDSDLMGSGHRKRCVENMIIVKKKSEEVQYLFKKKNRKGKVLLAEDLVKQYIFCGRGVVEK